MKNILNIVLFFVYIASYSQEKDSLFVGKWKIISIETAIMSYNTITDSLSYSNEFKELIPGILKKYNYENMESFNQFNKEQNSNNFFVFKEDGTYLRITNNKITVGGKYDIVPSEQIIKFSFKSSRNKIEKSSMKYLVKDDNLYLTLTFDERKGKKIKPTNFILKKLLIEE